MVQNKCLDNFLIYMYPLQILLLHAVFKIKYLITTSSYDHKLLIIRIPIIYNLAPGEKDTRRPLKVFFYNITYHL